MDMVMSGAASPSRAAAVSSNSTSSAAGCGDDGIAAEQPPPPQPRFARTLAAVIRGGCAGARLTAVVSTIWPGGGCVAFGALPCRARLRRTHRRRTVMRRDATGDRTDGRSAAAAAAATSTSAICVYHINIFSPRPTNDSRT